MQKHTCALRGLFALPIRSFVERETHLRVHVSVNTDTMSCHLSYFDIAADIQSGRPGGKTAQMADPQP